MNALSLARIGKSFGPIVAVNDLSLDIPHGQFVTLLGASGSGKSTLLRLIAGLDRPDQGEVSIDGIDVTRQPAHLRPSAMVFQRYALFPHMTVRQNVGFGLRQHGVAAEDARGRIDDALGLVSLGDRADAWPHQLSGGQEQRVALARALVVRPRILLLDEPLAALDANLRKRMQQELLAIQRSTGITFLAVTHDQDEALTMSDWIVLLDHGQVMQQGTARDLFERPTSRFVAEFMGAENVLSARVVNQDGDLVTVRISGNDLRVRSSISSGQIGVVVRPDAVVLSGLDEPGWDARVVSSSYKGTTHLITLVLEDETRIVAQIPTWMAHDPVPGDRLRIRLDPNRATLVPGV